MSRKERYKNKKNKYNKYNKNNNHLQDDDAVHGDASLDDMIEDKPDMKDDKKQSPILWGAMAVGAVVLVVGANVAVGHLFGNKHNQSSSNSTESFNLSDLIPKHGQEKKDNTPLAMPLSAVVKDVLHRTQKKSPFTPTQQQIIKMSQGPIFSANGASVSTGGFMNRAGTSQSDKNKAGVIHNPNLVYLNRLSQQQSSMTYAGKLSNLPDVIAQGKIIHGVLETPINSDLPNMILGHVTEDVYGQQGDRVLIPNGSRLVGTYRSGLVNGQSRLFVVWTRIIEPDGITVTLNAPGSDALGQAGMTGHVDYHYLKRFASSIMLTLLSFGAATSGVDTNDQYNSISAYRQTVSQALSQASGQELQKDISIPPTIHIPQGVRVTILVNKDISFANVLSNNQSPY